MLALRSKAAVAPATLTVLTLLMATFATSAASQPANAGAASSVDNTPVTSTLPDLPDVPGPTIGAEPTAAELEDLQFMADEQRITLEDSVRRFGWHQSFAMAVDEIREAHPEKFAGARIPPNGSPWVAFKGQPPPSAVSTFDAFTVGVFGDEFAAAGYRVDIIADRGYSERELDEQLQAAHFAMLAQEGLVANASSGYDIATGKVTVEVELVSSVQREPDQTAALNKLRERLSQEIANHDDVVLRVVDDVRVGNDANIYGGDAMSTCTTGFGVSKNGTRGVATAAHCGNSQKVGSTSLTFQGEHDGTWGDVQWHTSSAYETDDFYSGSSSSLRVYLRDVSARGDAVEGQSLCRNGKTTYKECDTVYQLNHCSWDTCHLTAMYNKEASGGDSGGPWFYGNTAYGLHQGYKWWNFQHRDTFTRATYVDDALPGVFISTT